MDWFDVAHLLNTEAFRASAEVDLAELSTGHPLLGIGLRAITRETGARTLGELAAEPDVEEILRLALPRQERRGFVKAMSIAVRQLAEAHAARPAAARGTAPGAAESSKVGRARLETPADEVPRGGEALSEWFVPPADVRCVVHRRLGRIDESRGGDASGPYFVADVQALDHGDDGIDDLLRPGGRGGHPIFHDDLPQLGDEGARDLGAADIDSDCMHAR